MRRRSQILLGATLGAIGVVGIGSAAKASITVDGTLSPGEGYGLVSTQTNITTSQASDGGGPGGDGTQATATSTGQFTNFSNAYAQIDPVANALDLFIGGSIEENNDSKYMIALQLNGSGVTSLAGQTINGANSSTSLDKVMFSTSSGTFAPTALFTIYPGNNASIGSGGAGTENLSGTPNTTTGPHTGVSYTDLTGLGYAAPSSVSAYLNNSLVSTPVGTGAGGDPGFAGANTGLEISIPLSTLGYTPGTNIEAFVFDSVGSDGRTNDQILSPFTSFTDSNGYDYTYIDSSNSTGSPTGRQFVQAVYPGQGYFVIPAAVVPEPASVGLLTIGGLGLLSRRRRSA